MDNTAKYLIHADVTADGVVERSDVVGAVFGQTEGLLGDELDLRDLQESSKVGRIDVEIQSERGQSFGHLTIETSLDKVETATLAAALETIEQIGPCRAKLRVSEIEDVRAAKRRQVIDRATELLVEGFSESVASSDEILDAVRKKVRVADVVEYHGLPAGPRVADDESDSVIVVEGRADVVALLENGVKNAVAVEGTDVPDAVADLTRERTVTAFLDGDRGGDLILEELSQVGEIDYVAFAPDDRSVEDLSRSEILAALERKLPWEVVADEDDPRAAVAAAAAASADDAQGESDTEATAHDGGSDIPPASAHGPEGAPPAPDPRTTPENGDQPPAETADDGETATDTADTDGETATDDADDSPPDTLRGHVRAVVDENAGTVRLLDADSAVLATGDAGEAFDLVESAGETPAAVVLDGTLTQRVLDVAAQRGVDQVVATELGEFTKRPTGTRIRTAEALLAA